MLNRHNFTIAALASKAGSRFTISGIQVTPTCTRVTDGHVLVEVSRPEVDATSHPVLPGEELAPADHPAFVLAADKALEIAKRIPKHPRISTQANVGLLACNLQEEARLSYVDGDYEAQLVRAKTPSGTFPDVRNIVPKKEDAKFTISLNAASLRPLLQWIESFAPQSLQHVVFSFTKAISPVRMDIDGGDGQHMTAVFMPSRTDADTKKTKEPAKVEPPVGMTKTRYGLYFVKGEFIRLFDTEEERDQVFCRTPNSPTVRFTRLPSIGRYGLLYRLRYSDKDGRKPYFFVWYKTMEERERVIAEAEGRYTPYLTMERRVKRKAEGNRNADA